MIHNWFINIACSRQVPTRRLNRSAPAIVSTFSGTFLHWDYTGRPRERAAQIPLAPVLVLHVPHAAYFTCHYQGVSHAEWPKDNEEYAPTQTGGAVCCSLKAVDIECRPPRVEGLSKRAKKL